MIEKQPIEAEATAVTKATVVSGLGYPNGREEESPSPTGWQTPTVAGSVTNVSRETSAKSAGK
jgi:hypothetical protein